MGFVRFSTHEGMVSNTTQIFHFYRKTWYVLVWERHETSHGQRISTHTKHQGRFWIPLPFLWGFSSLVCKFLPLRFEIHRAALCFQIVNEDDIDLTDGADRSAKPSFAESQLLSKKELKRGRKAVGFHIRTAAVI